MLDNICLDKAWIAAHIPHQSNMCLLDIVTSWDNQHIHCTASSHRLASNPLRSRDQLSTACGIEYAAQAMAVHGALMAPADSKRPRAGFLVSVRGATLHRLRLDDIATDLDVEAICIQSNGDNILYEFTLQAAGKIVMDGRAVVMLNAESHLGALNMKGVAQT
jgi:predicted hotdog family 3-hydroxylacyl-ACP dehydratase